MKILKLELKRFGNSLAVVLPDELQNRLNVAKADFVSAVEMNEDLLIVPLGLEIMAEHREIFRALAKM